MKKILTTLMFLADTITLSSPVFALSNNVIAYAASDASSITNIYETDVLDDLRYLTTFDENAYSDKEFDFIYFAEYNYSKYSSNHFNIFVYFYSDTSFILGEQDCYINMRNEAASSSYGNQYLQIIDETSGFYKALVLNSAEYYVKNLKERTYDVAGLSISTIEEGRKEYHDNEVGKTFRYTGFAAGIDGNEESTLQMFTTGLETISISVKGGTWHTASNFGHRNSLFYVWFGLDKDLTKGWYLKKIHYEYYCLKLATMYAGERSQQDYDSYSYWQLNDDYSLTQVVTYWNCRLMGQISQTRHTVTSNEIINDIKQDNARYFPINSVDTNIYESDIKYKVDNYYDSVVLESKYYNFDEENTDKSISIPNSNLNGFEQWWLKWIRGVDGGNTDLDQYDNFSAWTVINENDATLSNENFSSKYFVRDNQVSEMKADVEANNSDNKDTYLFRFDILPFFSDVVIADWTQAVFGGPEPNIEHTDHQVGYYFDSYYIKDFDIIDFTFQNDNAEIKIIPVVADPIDIADYAEPSDQFTFTKSWNWLLRILSIIILVIGVILILRFIIYLIKGHDLRVVKRQNKKILKNRRRK